MSSNESQQPAPLEPSTAETASSTAPEWQELHARAAVPVSEDDPSWGDPLAPVTMVMFMDYRCMYSARVFPTVARLRERYGPEKLRVVFKHHSVYSKRPRLDAEVALAVQQSSDSDAFWDFSARLFDEQEDAGDEVDQDRLRELIGEQGLDPTVIRQQLMSGEPRRKLDADMALVKALNSNGTPAFRINGIYFSGARPEAQFVKVIDKQLSEAEKLASKGVPHAEIYPRLVKAQLDQSAVPATSRKKQAVDRSTYKVPVYDDDPWRGGRDPLVTIVEFADFECPFSYKVESTLERLLAKYGDDLQIVWKDNPRAFHTQAPRAASLARSVYRTGGREAFWRIHAKLFESQANLNDNELRALLQGTGVSWQTASTQMSGSSFRQKLEQSQQLAKNLKAPGTPSFFVNGRRLTGARYDGFVGIIDEEMTAARRLVANGTPRAKVYEALMKDAKPAPGI